MSPTVTVASKPVGPIGYGLMGLTWRANPQPAEDSYRAMETALKLGANCWNGGELYGTPERHSCHLLKEYFTLHPDHADQVVLNIKGGTLPGQLRPDGSAPNVRRSVEDCLKVLDGTKSIDIFECARIDPNVRLEETITTLGELVKEGKIGAVGLSEVKASTIERAASILPVASVEIELSLWTTDVLRNGVAETCARLGIPILAYSPLSRGALAGEGIRRNADIPDGDFRKALPRFQDDVLGYNNRLVDEVAKLAARKGVTKAQIAINWVRCLSGRTIPGPDGEFQLGTIIPIPGATTPSRVTENATLVDLTDDEMAEIATILKQTPVKGDRYPEHGMALVEG
jgi:pyridoxine 4-dehydrogenase